MNADLSGSIDASDGSEMSGPNRGRNSVRTGLFQASPWLDLRSKHCLRSVDKLYNMSEYKLITLMGSECDL